MRSWPDRTAGICDRMSDGELLSLRYLVKRPVYELVLAVSPHVSPQVRWERAIVQARLTSQGGTTDVVLGLPELKAFYADMSQLMAYLSREGAHAGTAPQPVEHAVDARSDAPSHPDTSAKGNQKRQNSPRRRKRHGPTQEGGLDG